MNLFSTIVMLTAVCATAQTSGEVSKGSLNLRSNNPTNKETTSKKPKSKMSSFSIQLDGLDRGLNEADVMLISDFVEVSFNKAYEMVGATLKHSFFKALPAKLILNNKMSNELGSEGWVCRLCPDDKSVIADVFADLESVRVLSSTENVNDVHFSQVILARLGSSWGYGGWGCRLCDDDSVLAGLESAEVAKAKELFENELCEQIKQSISVNLGQIGMCTIAFD